MPLKWNPEKFKTAVRDGLVSNAAIVGKFVESDARHRLLGIREPAWGAAYRGYVSKLLDNEVVPDAKGVTINVGVGKGKGGSHHGLYIEMGSKTAGPHPFLRPAVFENAQKIVALLAGR